MRMAGTHPSFLSFIRVLRDVGTNRSPGITRTTTARCWWTSACMSLIRRSMLSLQVCLVYYRGCWDLMRRSGPHCSFVFTEILLLAAVGDAGVWRTRVRFGETSGERCVRSINSHVPNLTSQLQGWIYCNHTCCFPFLGRARFFPCVATVPLPSFCLGSFPPPSPILNAICYHTSATT